MVKVEVKHSPSHRRVFIRGVTSSDLDNETGPAKNRWQSSAESWLMQSFGRELQTAVEVARTLILDGFEVWKDFLPG